jgi:hypothetical protein
VTLSCSSSTSSATSTTASAFLGNHNDGGDRVGSFTRREL